MKDWQLQRGVKPDACKGCPRYARGVGFVPTDGPADAKILGVGRSASKVEGRVGRPYAAGAGRLFENLLHRAGLARAEIQLTNLVKCGADGEPTWDEVEYCTRTYLADELEGKKCAIAIGSMPAKVLCGVDRVKAERGTVHVRAGIPVVITLEPAGLIWSRSEAKNIGETRDYLPIVIKDLCKVKRIAQGQMHVSATREHLVQPEEAQVEQALAQWEQAPQYALDLETTYHQDKGKTITMMGLSFAPGKAITLHRWALQKHRERIQRILDDPDKTMIGHNNGQFDKWILVDNGWSVKNKLYDTMLADHLVESDMGEFGLEAVASRHLDYEPWKHIPTTDPLRNCIDVALTYELEQVLSPRLRELGSYDLLFRHQMPMADLCARASRAGIRVDREAMAKTAVACTQIVARMEKALVEAVGPWFNWRSPKQVMELLYDKLGMPIQLHRRTRKPTVDHYALEDLVKQTGSKLIETLIEMKKIDKLVGTFLTGENIHDDGRFHPSFLQHRAVTGRLSSTGPNVQQIPKGIARSMLVPDDEDSIFIAADFSQIEMRLGAWFSGDDILQERLTYYDQHPKDSDGKRQDVHRLHANRFYNDIGLDETKRSLAKNMYYGIGYGQGAHGLAIMYGVTDVFAQSYINFIFGEYKKWKAWRDGILNSIEDRNYLRNPYGRVRWLWNKNFATEAFIFLPQSTGYDVLAESAIELDRRLPSDVRQVMWIHDEIVVHCRADQRDEVSAIMRDVMGAARETLNGLSIPVKLGAGINYDDASKDEGLAGDWRRLRRTVR